MLAIVIPYYNIRFFDQTLNSLHEQTNQNFKVYIGDDNSPDDPRELLNKYIGSLDFHYQRFEDNLGKSALSKQWERCIKLINDEEWIMLLADDDYLEESAIENWYKKLNKFRERSNVVRFATQIIYEESGDQSPTFTHPEWEDVHQSFFRKYAYLTRSSLSEYFFKRSSYSKTGFRNFKLAWHSDDMAWIDFSEEKPIYTINTSIVYIRVSKTSISGKEDNLELKKGASIKFYRILLQEKLKFFKKEQKFRLLRNYEDLLESRGEVKYLEWFFLLNFYILFFDRYQFKKFLKRFFRSRFGKKSY